MRDQRVENPSMFARTRPNSHQKLKLERPAKTRSIERQKQQAIENANDLIAQRLRAINKIVENSSK